MTVTVFYGGVCIKMLTLKTCIKPTCKANNKQILHLKLNASPNFNTLKNLNNILSTLTFGQLFLGTSGIFTVFQS